MTARNQPHKYRCETCAYWDKSQFPHKWGCNKIKRWMDYSQVDWIIRVGCASHSDVGKAEQQIADVIKELGELTNALENMEPERGSENWCAMQAYKRCIALLREKGE